MLFLLLHVVLFTCHLTTAEDIELYEEDLIPEIQTETTRENNTETSTFRNNTNAASTNVSNVVKSKGSSSSIDCLHFLFNFNIVIGVICTVGLTGNTLSLFVLQKERGNQTSVLLLQALAVADNLLLATSFVVLTIFMGIVPYAYGMEAMMALRAIALKYLNPIGYIAWTCNVWITVLIAVNRFIAICIPLKAEALCTRKKTIIQILVVFSLSLAFNFLRFFQYKIIEQINPMTNATYMHAQPTAIGYKTSFGIFYENVIYSIGLVILPLITLAVINTKLIIALKKMHQNRFVIASRGSQPTERNITMVMVVIIVICIFCHTPDRILHVIKTFSKNRPQGCDDGLLFYSSLVCNLLIILNSTTNFLVYYVFRRKFRQSVVLMFCWKCASEKYIAKARRQSSRSGQFSLRNSSSTTYTNSIYSDHGSLKLRQNSIQSPMRQNSVQSPSVNPQLQFSYSNSRINEIKDHDKLLNNLSTGTL